MCIRDRFYIAGALHKKKIGGNRLGAISGAGFEAVGMADFTESENFAMKMGELAPATVKQLEDVLLAKKLHALVEVRNPIDINPGADDEAHLQIVEAFVQDPEIDAVVVGLDPTAPSVRAVSYTHLDVYKRQELLRGEETFDDVAQVSDDGVYVIRAGQGIDAFVASGDGDLLWAARPGRFGRRDRVGGVLRRTADPVTCLLYTSRCV